MSLAEPQPGATALAPVTFAPPTASPLEAPAGVSHEPDVVAAAAVLRALVDASAYRAALTPIIAEVEQVALLNLQIRAALQALAARPGFTPAGLLRRASADERAVKAFLEYVAFASPAFLGSVGEWPLGQQRG